MNAQVDITLTAEQKAGVIAAVDALIAALPFLRGYTPEERRRLSRLGPRRESFARLAVEAAQQNPNLVPASVDLSALARDKDLHDLLTTVRTQLQQVLKQVVDTQHAAGWDIYNGGLEIYRALKSHGRNSGLDETLFQLKTRLRTPSARTAEDKAPASNEGTNA